ncbi:receptor-type tyrosine-protein phosphatase epsilon-like [Corticium candelabrum]|uniref:receptor-type tyrosine-protein phosphatase epsilon-like n=1 Tax=Corticium candelabrum TaxID=121492 RepID=UPI002E260EC3|nr:receptor-type tyrosine-protein phosphatase epsilon-like [Corticium candelabrum]
MTTYTSLRWLLVLVWLQFYANRLVCVVGAATSSGLSSQTCEAPKVTSKTTTKIYLSLKCPSGNAAACHIKEYWIYFWRLHFVPESGTRKTSANTFAFVHLHPHTLYQFRVNATYNGQNCAKKPLALGPAVRVRTQAVAPNPLKTINVMTLGSNSLEIGWDSVQYRYGTVGYLVYYNLTQLKYESKSVKSTSVSLTGLTPYTKYEVKVAVVVRPWGANDGSEDVTSTTNRTKLIVTLHAKPSVPLDVTIDNNTLTAVSAKIVWTVSVNDPVVYYDVSYVMGLHSSASVSAITVRTVEKSNHITLKNLSPFTVYTVSVQAINIDRGYRLVSSASAVSTFRTLADAPSKPQNLKILDLQARAANFTWETPAQPNGPIAYYIIRVAMGRVDPQNYRSEKIVLRVIVSGKTSYTVDGLTQMTQYSVWIIAVNVEVSKELKSSPSQVQIFNTTGETTIHTTTVYTTKAGTTNAVYITTGTTKTVSTTTGTTKTVYRTTTDAAVRTTATTSNADTTTVGVETTAWGSEIYETAGGNEINSTAPQNISTSSSSSDRRFVTPTVVLILLSVSILVLVVAISLTRKSPTTSLASIRMNNFSANQNCDDAYDLIEYVPCSIDDSQPEISIVTFEKHLENLKADNNDRFTIEYRELNDIDVDQKRAIAEKTVNQCKNRYDDIVPYDDWRVMLDDVDGMETLQAEYINASYLDGCSRRKEYIVTQGPLKNTYSDFWRMVWLENAEFIVMLTRTVENGRDKCYQYWSDKIPNECGGLTVTVASIDELADYTVRKIILKLLDEERTVTHYHFRNWPVGSVPQHPTNLLRLLLRIRRESKGCKSPLIVHCNDGVGRSGTFVAIDILLNCFALKKKIDVKAVVEQMRARRMKMVDSLMQYIFIHDAILEAFYTSKTEILASNFSRVWDSLHHRNASDLNKFEEQFDTLVKLSPTPLQSKFEAPSLSSLRKRKNRNIDFLPPDCSRVILRIDYECDDGQYENIQKGADYINASYVNGYHKDNFFIVTQAPLPTTMSDMWKMVLEQKVSAIVNLAQPDECEQYWPQSGSQTFGQVNVDVGFVEERKSYKVYELYVTNLRRKLLFEISLFHYIAWPNEGYPTDLVGLVDMMSELDHAVKRTEGIRVIVHCCTGMGRTGVFCAAFNVLSQLQSEGVLNVLQMTQALQNERPRIIHTSEQYESIYSIADCFQNSERAYGNVK